MINAAAAHGVQALHALDEHIDALWKANPNSRQWPSPIRRGVSLSLFRSGSGRSRLLSRLEELEPENPREDVTEFHQSYKDQADAWIEAGEPQRAQSYVDEIIRTSFGIAYEKDYQMSDWANWFAIALKHCPESALRSFRTVAAGLATADAYSRGSNSDDAVATFLVSVLSYDSDTAHALIGFFWEEEVCGYLTALKSTLLAAFADGRINTEAAVSLLCGIYVPYTRRADEEILEAFVARLSRMTASPEPEACLGRLVTTIEREIAPKLCGDWWSILEEKIRLHPNLKTLRQAVEERLVTQQPVTHYTKGHVTLNDGTEIGEDDLVALSNEPSELLRVVEKIKDDHFYSWRRLISRFLADLDATQARAIYEAIESLGRHGRNSTVLLARLFELGDRSYVEDRAKSALAQSRSEGWSYYYDGGSRIEPYKILEKIDTRYFDEAFVQFADDYVQGFRPNPITRFLSDLAAVFWQAPPYDALWAEIFEHFSQLREFQNPAIVLPAGMNLRKEQGHSFIEALVGFAFTTFNMPQPEVRDDAFRVVTALYADVAAARPQIVLRLSDYLAGQGELPLLGLAFVRKLAAITPDLIEEFRQALTAFLTHEDMAVRVAARDILAVAGETPTIKQDRALSPAYTLALPPFPTLQGSRSAELAQPGAVLRDTQDPLQQVGAAQESLELIQQHATVPFRNLVERTALLMKTVMPEAQWNSEAETALQGRCKALGLETAYRRPKALAAFLALGHVVAELYDAGRLGERELRMLGASLSQADARMSELQPQGRNLSPVAPTVTDGFGSEQRDWLDAPPPTVTAPPRGDQDLIVLGFVTKADVPTWATPSELICGSICPSTLTEQDIKDKPDSIIPGRMMGLWWMADRYPQLPFLRTALEDSLLIRGYPQRAEIGRAPWLAINPLVAIELGWSYSDEGLFRWVNRDGHTVVQSEWWRTGRLKRFPPADEVRAEGWVVRISTAGFDELRRETFPATWAYGVRKTRKKDQDRGQRCWTAVYTIN